MPVATKPALIERILAAIQAGEQVKAIVVWAGVSNSTVWRLARRHQIRGAMSG